MDPKERVISQINHQETDYIPYTLEFEEDYDTRITDGVLNRLNSYFGGTSWRKKFDNHIVRVSTTKPEVDYERGQDFFTDLYGTVWRVNRRPYQVEKPALEEPSLKGYKFPRIEAFFDEGWYEKAIGFIDEKRDHFLVTSFGFGLFERTWAMRGLENALVDCIAHPQFYKELIERIFWQQMELLDKILTLPIDGFLFSDDFSYQYGVMIGADRWREFFKPYQEKMYKKVHDAGKYTLHHMCGSVAEILPDLIEIGLDVYESVQPEAKDNNPYRLKELYRGKITFWGGLGSQSIIPFGTPEEIKQEVSKLCKVMGQGGGYIFAPAKALQPETPTENALALIEAIAEEVGITI